MNKFKSRILLMFLAGVTLFRGASSDIYAHELKEGDYYTLTILHTNDIHGNVSNLPKYKTIVKQVESEVKNLLVVDSGDIFLRGDYQEFKGVFEANLLNDMGCDVWVPGNNDFRVPPNGGTIYDGNDMLQNIIDEANFDAVCANVTMKNDSSYMDNIPPYIVKDINDVNVAVIGVTSTKPQVREWEEVSDKIFVDGNIAVSAIIDEVSECSDVAIVISHTGLSNDLKTAEINGVSAVIGADDHYTINEPIYKIWGNKKTTPITQAGGEDYHKLGRLNLVFKYTNGKLVLDDYNGFLYDLDLVESDVYMQSIIDDYKL